MKWLKRILCDHDDLIFVRNVYGDEINELNCRSIYKCSNCEATVKYGRLNEFGQTRVRADRGIDKME